MLEQKIEALTEAVKALTAAMTVAQAPATAKVEKPKAETPKAEKPKAETPKAETPKAETPKAETPKAEKPKAEKTVNIDAISAKAVAFSRGKAGMADVVRAKMAELGGETLSKIKPEQLAVFEAWLDEQIGGEK